MKGFHQYEKVRFYTWTTSASDVDLYTLLGDAFLTGVMRGNGTGDTIQLKVGSQIVYDAASNVGSRENDWMVWPFSTRVIDLTAGTTNLVADVTLGDGGLITVNYLPKP